MLKRAEDHRKEDLVKVKAEFKREMASKRCCCCVLCLHVLWPRSPELLSLHAKQFFQLHDRSHVLPLGRTAVCLQQGIISQKFLHCSPLVLYCMHHMQ